MEPASEGKDRKSREGLRNRVTREQEPGGVLGGAARRRCVARAAEVVRLPRNGSLNDDIASAPETVRDVVPALISPAGAPPLTVDCTTETPNEPLGCTAAWAG
jgi:hypothetical protein